jgi:hypothetical protein
LKKVLLHFFVLSFFFPIALEPISSIFQSIITPIVWLLIIIFSSEFIYSLMLLVSHFILATPQFSFDMLSFFIITATIFIFIFVFCPAILVLPISSIAICFPSASVVIEILFIFYVLNHSIPSPSSFLTISILFLCEPIPFVLYPSLLLITSILSLYY